MSFESLGALLWR